LHIWGNNFTGGIPQQLGRNSKLLEVDLSSNKLTGFIPPDLCIGGKLQILILLLENNCIPSCKVCELNDCSRLHAEVANENVEALIALQTIQYTMMGNFEKAPNHQIWR